MLDRLSKLSDINRKYGNEEAALKHLDEMREKLKEYENISFDKSRIEKQYNDLLAQTHNLALLLQDKRQNALDTFKNELNHFGADLKLKEISLNLNSTRDSKEFIESNMASLGEHGYNSLDIFLDSVHKNNISSGEYNRLRLSMLCVMAKSKKGAVKNRGILILDEIDANLSGEESEGVAGLLKFLSKSYQIFAISHQPFMPLISDYHYLISRDSNDKGVITLLDSKGQIAEIARMISGSKLDSNALNYAKTLLEQKKK